MSLSISNIYDIFNSVIDNDDKIDYYLINFLVINFFNVTTPPVMKGWHQMDSKACYLILLEAEKCVIHQRVPIIPRGFKKDEIVAIYKLVYAEYKRCCTIDGYEKIPSLFDLEKRLKMKKLNETLNKN